MYLYINVLYKFRYFEIRVAKLSEILAICEFEILNLD